jgi:hypothetical protein
MRKVYALLFLFILPCSGIAADCPDLYSKILVDAEPWRSLQLNNPAQRVEPYTRIFLENVTDSTRKVFARDFESGAVETNLKKTLSEQHALLTNGVGGRYTGFFLGNPGKNDRGAMEALAGKFRPLDSTSNRLTIDMNLLVEHSAFDWKNRGKIIRDLKADPVVEISGIPAEGLPKNFLAENLHVYPGAKYIPQYVERMQERIMRIRKCDSCSRKEILGYIADYYHAGINAHLFLRANQSLMMSQVNYMLLRMGLNGIPPTAPDGQKLDTMALFLSGERFRKYFLEQVH